MTLQISTLPDETQCDSIEVQAVAASQDGMLGERGLRLLGELDCKLGDLRRMTEAELSYFVGLRAHGVGGFRELIGSPNSANYIPCPMGMISTPLLRSSRRQLDTLHESVQRGVSVVECFETVCGVTKRRLWPLWFQV